MNLKGENLGTYGLEVIKGSLADSFEVDVNFETWLGVLNPTS